MTSPRDQNVNVASSSSEQTQLQIVEEKRNKRYFFQFNDHSGEGILFSQGYSSQKAKNNGIATVLKNLVEDTKINRKTKGKEHFFILKAGNNQEIGRSKMFSKVSQMEKAVELLQSRAKKMSTKDPSTEKKQTPVPKAAPTAVPAIRKKLSAPKATFKISFYSTDSDKTLHGKIEFPFDQTRETFTGVDEKTILSFIKKHLPHQGETETATSNLETVIKRDEIQSIDILVDNKPIHAHALKKNIPFDLVITIPSQYLKEKSKTEFEVQVFAFLLVNGQKTLVGSISKQLLEKPFIQLPIIATVLPSGIYRLITLVTLIGEKKSKKDINLKGSRLLQLY